VPAADLAVGLPVPGAVPDGEHSRAGWPNRVRSPIWAVMTAPGAGPMPGSARTAR